MTTPDLTAADMIAEMRRIIDAIPQPAIVCHPSERDRIDAELTRKLPWNVPKPELMISTLVPPGQVYWIADTRPFKGDAA